jgi:hypothetical protein
MNDFIEPEIQIRNWFVLCDVWNELMILVMEQLIAFKLLLRIVKFKIFRRMHCKVLSRDEVSLLCLGIIKPFNEELINSRERYDVEVPSKDNADFITLGIKLSLDLIKRSGDQIKLG